VVTPGGWHAASVGGDVTTTAKPEAQLSGSTATVPTLATMPALHRVALQDAL
jgi:hypothetical protein